MAIRTLRRRVIIREYDFKKVAEQATALTYGDVSLYDRVSFTPLDQDALEKIKLQEILRGKSNILTELDVDFSRPRMLLYNLKDFLYNEKYTTWKVTEDEDGYICVQARVNTPVSRVGWGIFEKDYASRL